MDDVMMNVTLFLEEARKIITTCEFFLFLFFSSKFEVLLFQSLHVVVVSNFNFTDADLSHSVSRHGGTLLLRATSLFLSPLISRLFL